MMPSKFRFSMKIKKLCVSISLIFLPFHAIHSHENNARVYTSIRDVPIIENDEPLIDLKDQTTIAYDPSFLAENPDCTKIRKTIYLKLCEAQKLLPPGLRFEFNIGLRSLQVQSKMFDEMRKEILKKNPTLSEKELFAETSKFIAPVKTWEGVQNVPPHSTGGAIDLILIDRQGNQIDMGINPDDPYNEDYIKTDSTLISAEARKNRTIMAKALTAVGFVNYPAEFWHWSYGDRRWAFVKGAQNSIYGPVTSSK